MSQNTTTTAVRALLREQMEERRAATRLNQIQRSVSEGEFNPSRAFNSSRWLNAYRLEENQNIRVVDSEDMSSIHNINADQTTRNAFIERVLHPTENNIGNLIVNSNLSSATPNFLAETQNFINRHPNINDVIASVFVNSSDFDRLRVYLINFLNSENIQNMEINSITTFGNSFMAFLRESGGVETPASFLESLRELSNAFNAIQHHLEIDTLIRHSNQNIQDNIENSVTESQASFNETSEAIDRIVNNSITNINEESLRAQHQINENRQSGEEKLRETEKESIDKIEKDKEDILNKIKKFLSSKKNLFILLGLIGASAMGYTVPIMPIVRTLTSSINSYNSNIASSSDNINIPSEPVRFRDVLDLFIKKIFQKVEQL